MPISVLRYPPSVGRRLRERGFAAGEDETFGVNSLSRRLALPRDRGSSEDAHQPRRVFASLLAVPVGKIDDIDDLSSLVQFLAPSSVGGARPPWLPQDDFRFSSDGVYLCEQDYRAQREPPPWRSYILFRRDGLIEHSRQAGFTFNGRVLFEYAPLVQLATRFVEIVQGVRRQFFTGVPYWFVVILHDTRDGALCALGDRWLEPTRWDETVIERWTCLDNRVAIARQLDAEEGGEEVSRSFATRLGQAFGLAEQRCYNHAESNGRRGPPGTLPTDRLEFS